MLSIIFILVSNIPIQEYILHSLEHVCIISFSRNKGHTSIAVYPNTSHHRPLAIFNFTEPNSNTRTSRKPSWPQTIIIKLALIGFSWSKESIHRTYRATTILLPLLVFLYAICSTICPIYVLKSTQLITIPSNIQKCYFVTRQELIPGGIYIQRKSRKIDLTYLTISTVKFYFTKTIEIFSRYRYDMTVDLPILRVKPSTVYLYILFI